ncbi:DJ-1/PfpI family protein [Duganella sp. LX20W]|uniref:DJ-1/PfpI family protein n=1 Tax=Rugamonas brunnea TaxID=2758569 RepID=A0A7W2EPN7_9BURK|nr:DJ-1/PfpI family protein [Rugamonas brunnea]MBA5636322.1 DJ-1/PfpI family protein [Rugamonas brunnea]
MMNRRDLFLLSTALGLTAALPATGHARGQRAGSTRAPSPLPLPAEGSIPVAFVLSDEAVVIDFAGPWEVFENVVVPGRKGPPVFQLYTVAETKAPVRATGGMTIVPDYTFATAPAPKVIVIPAQGDPDEAMLAWIRTAAQTADLTMSVCMGAFLLARTGLLAGQAATTHHSAYVQFQMEFPDIVLKRGARYVESGKLASAGGLSSGIDLALRVVERYCGRDVAVRTADHLEYQGQGWLNPDANVAYAKRRVSTDQHPCCVVCEMDVDKASAPASVYRGRTYYFCMAGHKTLFDANPGRFLS